VCAGAFGVGVCSAGSSSSSSSSACAAQQHAATLNKSANLYSNTSPQTQTQTQIANQIKVVKLSETLLKAPADAQAQVPDLEAAVAEAYKAIDTAVTKGVLHANTAARRKARVAKWKRQVLIGAGLYKPAQGQPGFHFYERMQAKQAAAAAAGSK
jgi:small subunit ribosomal protein S20